MVNVEILMLYLLNFNLLYRFFPNIFQQIKIKQQKGYPYEKNKYKVRILLLILLLILIASNYITYYITGESLIDILFEEEHSVNRHWIVKKQNRMVEHIQLMVMRSRLPNMPSARIKMKDIANLS